MGAFEAEFPRDAAGVFVSQRSGQQQKEGRGRPGRAAADGLFGAVPFRRVQLFAGLHAGGGGHRGDGAAFDGADGLRDVADVYIIRSQRSCVRRQGQRYRAGAAGAGLYRDAEQDPGAVPGKSCVLRAVDAAHRRGLSGVCGAGSGAGCGLLCAAACRRIVFAFAAFRFGIAGGLGDRLFFRPYEAQIPGGHGAQHRADGGGAGGEPADQCVGGGAAAKHRGRAAHAAYLAAAAGPAAGRPCGQLGRAAGLSAHQPGALPGACLGYEHAVQANPVQPCQPRDAQRLQAA